MRLVLAFALVVLVGCSRPPPEPAFVTTSRPEEQTLPVAAPPASRCVAAAMRARIEDCSAASEPTREEVYLAIEESYRALAVHPAQRPPDDDGVPKRGKAVYEERLREAAPLPLIPEQETAISLLTSWVCRHPYDLAATYRLARLHFEHRRFEEAIVYFARVGDGPVEDDLTVEAFFRWLEAVNVVGSVFSVTNCFDEMEEKVPATRTRLCDFGLVALHPGRTATCTTIGRVNYDLDRMHLHQHLHMERL